MTGAVPPEVRLEVWPVPDPIHPGADLVMVEVLPSPATEEVKRRPVDLVLTIDRSSSMRGNRINEAMKAVQAVGSRLTEDDRFFALAFDRHVKVLLPNPVSATPYAIGECVRRLSAMRTGLGTNIEQAIRASSAYSSLGAVPGASKCTLMITDGYPSQGELDSDVLVDLVHRERAHGVVGHFIGVGQQFNEELLVRMAKAGAGFFRYSRYSSDLARIAAEVVDGVSNTLADDAVLVIGARANLVARFEIQTEDLERRWLGDNLEAELGPLMHGVPRRVLLRVTRTDNAKCGLGSATFGEAKLIYSKPADSSTRTVAAKLVFNTEDDNREARRRVGAALVPLRVGVALRDILRFSMMREPEEVAAQKQALLKTVDHHDEVLREIPHDFLWSVEARQAIAHWISTTHSIRSEGRVSRHCAKSASEVSAITGRGATLL